MYVVGRKYETLPNLPEGDVDIYIRNAQFDGAIEYCENLGFERQGTSVSNRWKYLLGLFRDAVSDHRRAISKLLNSPDEVFSLLTRTAAETDLGHRNIKLKKEDVNLDIRNNLAYKSPMNGSRIPVDPSVTGQFFDRRREYNGFYVPHESDELAHIVSHCIFDKEGKFSSYYRQRCDELVEHVTSEKKLDEAFQTLLSKLFYDASNLVYKLINNGQYDNLLSELYAFSDY